MLFEIGAIRCTSSCLNVTKPQRWTIYMYVKLCYDTHPQQLLFFVSVT